MIVAICIYGLPASGKSTFVTVAEEYGIPTVTMGDVVRDRAKQELTQPVTGEDIGEWATEQRNKHGKEIMAQYTVTHIKENNVLQNNEIVVIEGVRSLVEIKAFKNEVDAVQPVRIKSPFDRRLKRLQDRDEDRPEFSENGITESELKKRDNREREWGLKQLLRNNQSGEITIHNTGTLEQYKNEITTVIETVQERTEA